jgi:dUTP pyrophosphatase
MNVAIRRLPHAANLPLPAYATPGAAGLDLMAAIEEPRSLAVGERALVPTGLVIELAEGTEGQVRPRSGLALRHGLTVLNAPGTIDSDYRGEIQVLLINLGHGPVVLHPGDRIAQLVIAPVSQVHWTEHSVEEATERGVGGFGSTGR